MVCLVLIFVRLAFDENGPFHTATIASQQTVGHVETNHAAHSTDSSSNTTTTTSKCCNVEFHGFWDANQFYFSSLVALDVCITFALLVELWWTEFFPRHTVCGVALQAKKLQGDTNVSFFVVGVVCNLNKQMVVNCVASLYE